MRYLQLPIFPRGKERKLWLQQGPWTKNIYVAGICGNPAFPEIPRQFRKSLEFPQLPRHFWKCLGRKCLISSIACDIYSGGRISPRVRPWPSFRTKIFLSTSFRGQTEPWQKRGPIKQYHRLGEGAGYCEGHQEIPKGGIKLVYSTLHKLRKEAKWHKSAQYLQLLNRAKN